MKKSRFTEEQILSILKEQDSGIMTENQEWAVDFIHDCLENGRQFRAQNIIDPHNQICKGVFVSYSIAAARLVEFNRFIR